MPSSTVTEATTDGSRTLAGRVGLIVGAGEGIGRSCALALAADGADVIVAARNGDRLEDLAAEVRALSGRRVEAIAVDITDTDAVASLVDRGVDALGRLDVVVNVAARSGPQCFVEALDPDELRRSFEVNVVGTLEVCRRSIPHLRASGGGSIVQISALSAYSRLPGLTDYTASKAALVTASLTLAREVGRDGIRVNVVVPGYTRGRALDAHLDALADRRGTTRAAVEADILRGSALRTMSDPADIAEAVLFLASARSRTITGQQLHVNAGEWIA